MYRKKRTILKFGTCVIAITMLTIIWAGAVYGGDLLEIKEKGVLRHLGVPYANFVTGSGDGMDVELMQLFAKHIGVRYEYVQTDFKHVIGDVTGKKVNPKGKDVEILGEVPVRGDIIANGLTVIPWRQKVVNYSTPTFPTQVWLIARADSDMKPIKPSKDIDQDIAAVKSLIKGRKVLGKARTCLDPVNYNLKETGAKIVLFAGGLNEMAPAIINGEAEATILDVPDALIALEKWAGKIKVIGPISPKQVMGCGFSKTSPQLREAFNDFLGKCKVDGTYISLVKKYYPAVFVYYPEFFKSN